MQEGGLGTSAEEYGRLHLGSTPRLDDHDDPFLDIPLIPLATPVMPTFLGVDLPGSLPPNNPLGLASGSASFSRGRRSFLDGPHLDGLATELTTAHLDGVDILVDGPFQITHTTAPATARAAALQVIMPMLNDRRHSDGTAGGRLEALIVYALLVAITVASASFALRNPG